MRTVPASQRRLREQAASVSDRLASWLHGGSDYVKTTTVETAERGQSPLGARIRSELHPVRAEALLGGVEIVDDDRDVPEPGRLRLTAGRLSLGLEQPELQIPQAARRSRCIAAKAR